MLSLILRMCLLHMSMTAGNRLLGKVDIKAVEEQCSRVMQERPPSLRHLAMLKLLGEQPADGRGGEDEEVEEGGDN